MSSPYDSNKLYVPKGALSQHDVTSLKSVEEPQSVGLFAAGAVVIFFIVIYGVCVFRRKSSNREPGEHKQDFRETSHNELSVPQCSEKDRQLLNLMTSLDKLINKDN